MATSRTGTGQWKRVRAWAIREAIANSQETCLVCGVWIDYGSTLQHNSPEVDHIIPHSRGGTDTQDNVRVICRQCNQRRGNKPHNAKARPAPLKPATTITW